MFSSPPRPTRESIRLERIADQIRMEVADILAKKASDPRVLGVSIVGADVSSDLRNADLFVSVPREEKKALQGLAAASGFIRSELARRLALRRVPRLVFRSARETSKESHLLELLDQVEQELREKQDSCAPSPPDL